MCPLDFVLMEVVCVCLGPGVCAGAAGDAEQRGSAAAERRSVGGALWEGHGSADSGRSTWLNITELTLHLQAEIWSAVNKFQQQHNVFTTSETSHSNVFSFVQI